MSVHIDIPIPPLFLYPLLEEPVVDDLSDLDLVEPISVDSTPNPNGTDCQQQPQYHQHPDILALSNQGVDTNNTFLTSPDDTSLDDLFSDIFRQVGMPDNTSPDDNSPDDLSGLFQFDMPDDNSPDDISGLFQFDMPDNTTSFGMVTPQAATGPDANATAVTTVAGTTQQAALPDANATAVTTVAGTTQQAALFTTTLNTTPTTTRITVNHNSPDVPAEHIKCSMCCEGAGYYSLPLLALTVNKKKSHVDPGDLQYSLYKDLQFLYQCIRCKHPVCTEAVLEVCVRQNNIDQELLAHMKSFTFAYIRSAIGSAASLFNIKFLDVE